MLLRTDNALYDFTFKDNTAFLECKIIFQGESVKFTAISKDLDSNTFTIKETDTIKLIFKNPKTEASALEDLKKSGFRKA